MLIQKPTIFTILAIATIFSFSSVFAQDYEYYTEYEEYESATRTPAPSSHEKNITKTLEPTTGSPSASPSASPTTGTPSTSPTKSPKVMCNHRRKYDDAIAFCNSTGTSLCNFEQLETRVNNTGGFTCNEYWVFDELLGASYKNCKRQQRVVRMNKAKRFACRSRHKKKRFICC